MQKKAESAPHLIMRWISAHLLFFIFFLSPFPFAGYKSVDITQDQRGNHSGFRLDDPKHICNEFFSPFNGTDRKSLSLLKSRVTGIYGEYRRSYRPGHYHAGLDLQGGFEETVYPIGFGWVVRIFRQFPHKSIVVEHRLPDDSILYSMYVHIEDVQVRVGDWVDENTPLARLFNEEELEVADFGTPNHLHLEIRKTLADRGRASYSSMSMTELNKVCTDPLKFFREHWK
jgi:murein DD-endopeptidase MepM/ murein hydrolase activator NlpD